MTLAVLFVASGTLLAIHVYFPAPSPSLPTGVISVVAAENFWGSLVAQLGGSHVRVLSIVTDPNADPHEYETNVSDAVAIANARLVIENGAGYDDWCQQLVAANAAPSQTVLNVADLLGKAPGDNPHFWYHAAFVNATLAAMYTDLVSIDPANASAFRTQYADLNASLTAEVFGPEATIRAQFAGTAVGATESIFVYLANDTGLNLVSPPEFMTAVSEGVDPPTSSVTTFVDQLSNGTVRVLVYNNQTVTPTTSQMESIATAHQIPLVAITETISPLTVTYQAWLGTELVALSDALATAAGLG